MPDGNAFGIPTVRGAVAGNIPAFDAAGRLQDSGNSATLGTAAYHPATDFLLASGADQVVKLVVLSGLSTSSPFTSFVLDQGQFGFITDKNFLVTGDGTTPISGLHSAGVDRLVFGTAMTTTATSGTAMQLTFPSGYSGDAVNITIGSNKFIKLTSAFGGTDVFVSLTGPSATGVGNEDGDFIVYSNGLLACAPNGGINILVIDFVDGSIGFLSIGVTTCFADGLEAQAGGVAESGSTTLAVISNTTHWDTFHRHCFVPQLSANLTVSAAGSSSSNQRGDGSGSTDVLPFQKINYHFKTHATTAYTITWDSTYLFGTTFTAATINTLAAITGGKNLYVEFTYRPDIGTGKWVCTAINGGF